MILSLDNPSSEDLSNQKYQLVYLKNLINLVF